MVLCFRGSERSVNSDIDQVRGTPVLREQRDVLEVRKHVRELLRARRGPYEPANRSVQREVGRIREGGVRRRRRREELDGLGQPEARRDFAEGEDVVGVCGVRDGLERDLELRKVPVEADETRRSEAVSSGTGPRVTRRRDP